MQNRLQAIIWTNGSLVYWHTLLKINLEKLPVQGNEFLQINSELNRLTRLLFWNSTRVSVSLCGLGAAWLLTISQSLCTTLTLGNFPFIMTVQGHVCGFWQMARIPTGHMIPQCIAVYTEILDLKADSHKGCYQPIEGHFSSLKLTESPPATKLGLFISLTLVVPD